MTPTNHGGRRENKARALSKQLGNEEYIVYTDASKDQGTTSAAAVVTTKENMLTSVSVEVKDVEEAEEVAIALVNTLPGRATVITDSQQAYRSFQSDWVSRKTLLGAQKQETSKGARKTSMGTCPLCGGRQRT
ncbi:hypothetical protein HPB47_020685 [Ixodes persulcatus]|uniref:Uncharacterized protein n=1 Tax=Ixodes persulcatus TaxID=34615 RepID=A0AC60QER4_IXOPE|nr:hypothetical protein HPB47_020685 [Ixodes persulcatus]